MKHKEHYCIRKNQNEIIIQICDTYSKYNTQCKWITKNDNEYSSTQTSPISDEHRLMFCAQVLSIVSNYLTV